MREIELKFLIQNSRLKGLMRQARVKSSKVTQLAAHYYDTPKQKLAHAGIGLRIRKEGDTWVQTIKAGGDGIAARLEHNAKLDSEQVEEMLDNNQLMPDLTIYKNTPIAPALASFKRKKLNKNLTKLYVTDVERTTRILAESNDNEDDNSIEVAYDYGKIIHGSDEEQQFTIHEIEFELISGDIDFLFATAKTWCKRYKLCLSTVTKAERGGLLINGQNHSPAVSADLSQLIAHKDSSMPAFIRAAVHNCLLHILPNSRAIVAGSENDDHVLQLRLGLSRLQAAINTFAGGSDEINPDWLPILKQTTSLLSNYRDLTYISNHIDPGLQQHGAPAVNWEKDIDTLKIKPIDAVSANDFQLMLLDLIAFTMSDPNLEPNAETLASEQLPNNLSVQQKQLTKALNDFEKENDSDIDDSQALTEIDNQINNLCYSSELAAPLLQKKYSKKKTKRWLKHLLKTKKALQQYRGHSRFQQHYQKKSKTDPQALFGVGWYAIKLNTYDKQLKNRLAKLKGRAVF
ncbi:MAG: CYTH and CHAD domain-containing protein [Psychrobacter sp.]